MWALEPGCLGSILTLLLTSYMTLGKLFDLYVPWFPQVKNGEKELPHSVRRRIKCKVVETVFDTVLLS